MQPEEKDLALLWDMRNAAQEIIEFVGELDYQRFESSKIVRYAVERQILVIGEAAKRVSAKLKKENPHIPWDAIVGQRNLLAHEYGEILVERIWRVATERIPQLIRQLDALIPEPSD